MEYSKPWLSIADQIAQLRSRGLAVPDQDRATGLLQEVGYYRLTGYLHPFRSTIADRRADPEGRRLLSDDYRQGTTLDHADALLSFDRELRLLVIEGVERIEVAVRTRLAHTLGRSSAFAHEEATTFTAAFTEPREDRDGAVSSAHAEWLERVQERQAKSDEAFVAHFRARYDGRMPIWALTEILELGHVSRLYAGLRNDIATEIAAEFGVPTKRLMQSWLASVNYVRNVAAHHARLFNRKLVVAPKRPKRSELALLDHLAGPETPKQFGVYNALAVMAFFLRAVPSDRDWAVRMAALMRAFPDAPSIDVRSMGVAPRWLDEPLWRPERSPETLAGTSTETS
ncbi:abortive infection bacteriophage resistance protein [Curtobacterium flaccumfaciens]|uniref:Abortive infection bacteriophage resistance protein n=1 Tax=Curtobacterium flaccumfaciens TaxID=2035 RepID=A0A4R6DLP5_9MICO|nr:Abi family protein [Curtobacterium flaccumfaciens]TDN45384.1 abortive infection bacteriophage resistance protein [Curtobacterium flaccumfaciens]